MNCLEYILRGGGELEELTLIKNIKPASSLHETEPGQQHHRYEAS